MTDATEVEDYLPSIRPPGAGVEVADDMNRLEAAMLEMPQLEIRLTHSFAPGLYIREMTVPAGATLVGHAHRFPSLSLMLKGKAIFIDGAGERREVEAPYQVVSPPGRKVFYFLEETVWMNVFANPDNGTDIEAIEERLVDKADVWRQARAEGRV